MANHTNPFKPGSGLQPPYLAGRDRELERFSQMLRHVQDGQVRNLMVQGLRGVGKTVLLKKFMEICIGNRFLPVTQLQFSSKHSDPEEFIRVLQYELNSAISNVSKVGKAKQRLQDTVRQMKPQRLRSQGLDGNSHMIRPAASHWRIRSLSI